MSRKDVVCIYSGGMDSFTLVAKCHAEGRLHSCLSFNYGQRHVKELHYAKDFTSSLGVDHPVIDLSDMAGIAMLDSALTDNDRAMPEGHYQAENMKQTVVPNRNMIMLSVAIAYAVSRKLNFVWFGAHSGDHDIYPDCRPEFVEAIDTVAQMANWHKVGIQAPFIMLDKAAILRIGYGMNLDYGKSWTCYAGRERACGKCGSCQERLEGFRQIGKDDPLEYETDPHRHNTAYEPAL